MNAVIIILTVIVLFLTAALGYANTRRRQAENLHSRDQGYIQSLQEENKTLRGKTYELYELLNAEQSAHQKTVCMLRHEREKASAIQENDTAQTSKQEYHEMAVDIVKTAFGGALKESINPLLKNTVAGQLGRVNKQIGKGSSKK